MSELIFGFFFLVFLIGYIDILFTPEKDKVHLHVFVLSHANLLFVFSSVLWLAYDPYEFPFQLHYVISMFSFHNFFLHLAIDGVSVTLIFLSAFLLPFCILVSWQSIVYRIKLFYFLLYSVIVLLFFVFTAVDLLFFYFFFEVILIPMFILIGIWGSRERKIQAAYKFFIYTFIGSVFFLIAILFIYSTLGSVNYFVILASLVKDPFLFSIERQFWLTLAFMASFGVKIPLFPVHLWLPEAHVEASTAGSVLLAGILLKMGGYGIFRFVLPFFPQGVVSVSPFFFMLALLGVFYTSLTNLRQVDLKKIIAYSSVGHMAYVVLGLFSYTVQGIEGAIFVMISHGFISSALFIAIGILYERYKTRIIFYYGGLVDVMPLFATAFFILTFANMGFPGTSSFVGELLVLLSLYTVSPLACILASIGLIISIVYSIWLYNRVFYGQILSKNYKFFADINAREFFLLFPFVFFILLFGVQPNLILELIHNSVIFAINV